MHKSARAFVGLSLSLASAPAFADLPPAVIQAEPLTGVLERIRQDVGYYEVQAARWRADIKTPVRVDGSTTDPLPAPAEVACSVRDFDFDVTNVQVTLQTVTADIGSGSVGLSLPLIGKEGEAGAEVSMQVGRTQTISLTRRFSYSKEQLSQYQETEDYQGLEAAHEKYRARDVGVLANPVLPIANALIDLHSNLLRSAEKLPCFEWADKDVKPESSSVTLEFLVQRAADVHLGFNFLIVSGKTDGKVDHTNVNTLVVSFAPHFLTTSTSGSEVRQFGEAKASHDVVVR